jgi:pimeloyl-ACP methyl ester carboxylesterase
MINVGGHAMRVQMASLGGRKAGEPVVVLESGAISPLENWDPVFDRIAAIAPVIAYDRRGIGKSESDMEPQTLKHVASSVHALLTQMKVTPPYVLVGHSYGGILIREFARDFPMEVRGLVYLDAPDIELTYAELDAISPDARRIVFEDLDSIPPNLPAGPRAEIDNIRRVMANDMAEARAVRPPAGIPATVLIAAGKFERSENPPPAEVSAGLLRLDIKHEQEWALTSPEGLLVVARNLSHYVHKDDPALIGQLIRHALEAAGPSK